MRYKRAWALSSRHSAAQTPGAQTSGVRAGAALVALLLLGLLAAPDASSTVFHGRSETAALAFPDADRVETETFILLNEQARRVEVMARSDVVSKLVKVYTGYRGDEVIGFAIIDIRVVRTKEHALLIVLDSQGQVRSLRMLAFHEPEDYLPTDRWFRQFNGKRIRDDMRPGRDVHGVVGATLSTHAVADAVRRAVAIHEVILKGPFAAGADAPREGLEDAQASKPPASASAMPEGG